MIFLYNLFITAYNLAIRLAGIGNKKAKAWVEGRKNLFEDLQKQMAGAENVIWMHCASAGEFEQGKPVVEALKKKYPDYRILVTFFSPSGFEAAKKYSLADFKTYLPLDTKGNAASFLSIVKPKLVIFIKYDYWFHFLRSIREQNFPLLLVSALFRENSIFFKPYGGFYRKMLHFFTFLFVQDQESKKLLETVGITHCGVAGDTRFDRVSGIAANFSLLPLIEKFIGEKEAIIAGSTWPEDEELLSGLSFSEHVKLILAPHEINKSHLEKIKTIFPDAVLYSSLEKNETTEQHSVLIIDNFGMLSRLYYYATLTFIGGGFNKSGIHNTLEAAVWGKPVLFGPNYQKFKEAKDLISQKAAFSVSDKEEIKAVVQRLLQEKELLKQTGESARNYVQKNKGATQIIMDYIQENRLLTKL